MTAVMIGIDPHKRSNTALVLDGQENVLARQRFTNDRDGYRQLKPLRAGLAGPHMGVEGARGVGLGLAQRIAADDEQVVNVPARLSARVRVLGDGSGRKTDDTDAYAGAVAGLRGRDLQLVAADRRAAVRAPGLREQPAPTGRNSTQERPRAAERRRRMTRYPASGYHRLNLPHPTAACRSRCAHQPHGDTRSRSAAPPPGSLLSSRFARPDGGHRVSGGVQAAA